MLSHLVSSQKRLLSLYTYTKRLPWRTLTPFSSYCFLWYLSKTRQILAALPTEKPDSTRLDSTRLDSNRNKSKREARP